MRKKKKLHKYKNLGHTFVHYRRNQYWIGLSAPDPGTGYVWSDGSPVSLQFLTLYNGLCSQNDDNDQDDDY